ncbi:cupin domain-containing protein [Cohnella pontilimi]|uniref:Cupin domain-containing protein n=1 Tax=Cohnella pontilimi TaxID=2564100 RepID=A0A4U0FGY5_9BACL|nr:sugar phosphate nucleotidyltransferase [Cohnella pontilimi]TJY44207.1 cupin domain-containing protein [Cohnella pontilimi]
MKLVLLSGGSGKRLWPLSNDTRSKQFLKILDDGNGGMESMVQRVWRQLTAHGLAGHACIVCNRSQREILLSQLGEDAKIIFEPARRDTFPAVMLAAIYLFDVEKVDPGEVVCVLPVDPYVEMTYFDKIIELESVLEASRAKLALMGVKPDHPSENYGYIVPRLSGGKDGYFEVERFVEKPEEALAAELISKQAMWNCGVFAFRLQFILDILQKRDIPTQYEWMLQHFEDLHSTSFDYEVVERTSPIVVLPYEGTWKDLGTWDSLTEELHAPVIGNGQQSEDSVNTHLINELDIPVTVLGVANAVIAVSPDGILVADKSSSPRLKQMIKGIDQHPMYAERLWGWYRILDFTKNEDGFEVLTKRFGIHAGKHLSYQVHEERTEIWTVISGRGECMLDGERQPVGPGTSLKIPPGTRHAIKAHSDLELIEVQMGRELIEEDIRREALDWEEIGQSGKNGVAP